MACACNDLGTCNDDHTCAELPVPDFCEDIDWEEYGNGTPPGFPSPPGENDFFLDGNDTYCVPEFTWLYDIDGDREGDPGTGANHAMKFNNTQGYIGKCVATTYSGDTTIWANNCDDFTIASGFFTVVAQDGTGVHQQNFQMRGGRNLRVRRSVIVNNIPGTGVNSSNVLIDGAEGQTFCTDPDDPESCVSDVFNCVFEDCYLRGQPARIDHISLENSLRSGFRRCWIIGTEPGGTPSNGYKIPGGRALQYIFESNVTVPYADWLNPETTPFPWAAGTDPTYEEWQSFIDGDPPPPWPGGPPMLLLKVG